MIHRALILLILVCSSIAGLSQSTQAPGAATISASVNLIKVPISVFDDAGNMIQSLRREDFRLYENGVAQDIRSFGVDHNPVSVVLLLDTSGSVQKELKQIKDAAENFANALSAGDRLSVISFSDEVVLLQDWTSEKKQVHKALRKLEPGLRTSLYDALFTAATDQVKNVDGRKAIILLTDGLNNQSTLSFQDAALSVVQSQASLYVVSKTVMARAAAMKERRVVFLSTIYKNLTGDDAYVDQFFKKKEAELSDLSEKTGGRAFFPSSYEEIKDVYGEVARELKSKYFLTYISNTTKHPNSYNRISLEYFPPSSKLTYRQGYYYEPNPIHKRRY